MNHWRKKIYEILEPGIKEGSLSRIYDIFMIVVIILCTIPLVVRESKAVFDVFDGIAVTVFSIDYILRLITILSDFVGIAVIALPTGVVTAGYLEELRILDEEKQEKSER